ncbi:MAG: hypothetical protein M3Y82_04085 [Verrucomicrobiota bacterium]|nr:hypothetical protein [Verrucomicrobiota bacterium]
MKHQLYPDSKGARRKSLLLLALLVAALAVGSLFLNPKMLTSNSMQKSPVKKSVAPGEQANSENETHDPIDYLHESYRDGLPAKQ